MAGIRVNTGVKRIEVNDNGDYITLSLDDDSFLNRFFGMYENVQSLSEEYAAKEAAIREKHKDGGKSGGNSMLGEIFPSIRRPAEP